MAAPIRTLIVGLGPIGQSVAREISSAPDLRIVGAVDPAPSLAGKDLGELLGDPSLAGRKVWKSLEAVGRRKVDVAVHMAASRFPVARGQIGDLVRRGWSVVSTCEETIAADVRWPRQAKELDRLARRVGVAVISTGVNPGFVMDLVPAAITNVCVSVRSIRVTRHVDTSRRRGALQEKTGAGITLAEFRERARENRIGHVGLRDSLLFLMSHVALEGEVGEEKIRPIVAKKAIVRGARRIPAGRSAGVHHTVQARHPKTGKIVASYELKMAFGLSDPHDEIRVAGDPPLHLRFEGGVSGDRATVGSVLSSVRYALDAPPGFGT